MAKESKLKILELCHFSAGGCGVWQRVKQESIELAKRGYEVQVFSSNFEKGTDKIMPSEEEFCGVNIRRFPAKRLGGESFMHWKFEKEAMEYSPDVIFAHNYRQLPTTTALRIAAKLRKGGKKCKVFLVTHAPFVEGDITRSSIAKVFVKLYDYLIGPITLNKFDKILTISKWEIPYLLEAGAKKENIIYIPNGIPEEFFKMKNAAKEENKILFLGRIAPKKKIETLIEAIPYLDDKKLKIEIVGPYEEEYFAFLKDIIKKIGVEDRISFPGPIYDLREKIKKMDSARIFVLPSRVEGMPQAFVEAMARAKLVIGSDSIAIRDLIEDNRNGYLFEFDNPKNLGEKINLALRKTKDNQRIEKAAKKFAEQFSWKIIIQKIESLFNAE